MHATFGVSRPSLHKWKIRHATTISIAKHASINLGPQYATRCNRLAVPRRPPAASLAGFPNPTTTALRRGSPPVRCPKRQARARDTSALPIHFAQVPNRQGWRRRRPQSRNRPDSVRFFGAISCACGEAPAASSSWVQQATRRKTAREPSTRRAPQKRRSEVRTMSHKVIFLGQGTTPARRGAARRRTGKDPPARLLLPGGLTQERKRLHFLH